jgi:hypothetical protein
MFSKGLTSFYLFPLVLLFPHDGLTWRLPTKRNKGLLLKKVFNEWLAKHGIDFVSINILKRIKMFHYILKLEPKSKGFTLKTHFKPRMVPISKEVRGSNPEHFLYDLRKI